MMISHAPAPIAPTPNHGVVSVHDIASDPAKFDGGQVTVNGTYLHSSGSLFDSDSVASIGVPGPIKGASSLKLDGLDPTIVDALQTDASFGTGERWGNLTVTGILAAAEGAATLEVESATLMDAVAADTPRGGFVD